VPFAVKVTAAGVTLNEKSASGAAACTESDACAVAVWPFAVVVNVTVAVVVAAEEAAVRVSGRVVPGVTASVNGEMVTPAGSTDTVTGAIPPPASAEAVSSREAC
jgi:hypothetical protein